MDAIYSKNGDRASEKILLLPLIHVLQVPEKNQNIFSKLGRAINFWFKLPDDRLKEVEGILRMLRSCNHLFEELTDSSTLRKGTPTAYSIYGGPFVLNAYYYETFVAMERLQGLGGLELLDIVVEHSLEKARGDAMELYWRDSGLCPSEEEYEKMAIRKVGNSILLAFRLVQLFGENRFDFTKLAEKLGLFIQIHQDYQSFKIKETDFVDLEGSDSFSEGRFSFPVIHAVRCHPENAKIITILKKRTKNWEMRRYCVELMDKSGSIDYTKQVLARLMEEIMEEVAKLEENPYLLQILEFVSENLDVD